MPSRRSPAKAKATLTPLAAAAPTMPARPIPTEAAELEDAPVLPTNMITPAIAETAAEETIETDTAPANERRRSRPGARKAVVDAAPAPSIPRTIAEMQERVEDGAPVIVEDAEEEEEEPIPTLLVPPRTLVLTAVLLYAILSGIPSLALVISQRAGAGDTTSTIVYCIAFAVAILVAFALLGRAWRAAYGEPPMDLHPRSILTLWERRQSGFYSSGRPKRNGWVTASLSLMAGAVFLLLVFIATAALQTGLRALYVVPSFILLPVLDRALGAAVFVGYLYKGLTAVYSRVRATLIIGILYSIVVAATNAILLAAPNTSAVEGQTVSTTNAIIFLLGVAFVICPLTAWFRLQSRSVYAAVAFQITLFLLGFRT